MSTAATQQQPPVIPPRPNRSQDRDQPAFPKVPARPVKRGPSPNPDRYAQSPLNGGIPTKKDRQYSNGDPIDRSKSVELPAVVGEEGMEYAALADELASSRANSPETTRSVVQDLKIHAPKATMPAQSAKQRIMQVTRTDSDKAASFGIGKPSSDIPSPSNRSLRKKASTTSAVSRTSDLEDEEHGIPEIGTQVPLLAHAGDVQAPSPTPGSMEPPKTHHKRRSSSRALPPGSYGLHGHNVAPQDKLEKEYYQKHPNLLKSEHHSYQHDRATDYSMSSEKLNKMVRDTESGGHGVGTSDHAGAPSEQAAWAAYSEAASRPQSTKPQEGSPLKNDFSSNLGPDVIVVEEPNRRRSVLFSDEAVPAPLEEDNEYRAPILAEDEVRKSNPRPDQVPAVELSRGRRGSDYEMEPPRSRPTSRPASLYRVDSSEVRSTPLEDVIEYEPLFPEDDEYNTKQSLTAAQIKEMKQRFPSRDIWEDAPNSVHYTAEVNTPELEETEFKRVPSRDQNETPAQAFARKQEELAEKELTHPDAFLWRNQKPPTFVAHQSPLSNEGATAQLHSAQDSSTRPTMAQRFPSRDVWEDTPDSLKLETTVSGPQTEEIAENQIEEAVDTSAVGVKPVVPSRPQRKSTDPKEKPAIPERPKTKSPEEITKPVIPDRPKPQVPARPAKSSPSAEAPAIKPKPAVPARPMGNKIAALQAGFMSDLNKKLGLGPQAPKKDEPESKEAAEEPKEKAPLSDARKGRARGPQRRAPAAAAAPMSKPAVTTAAAAEKPKLSFSTAVTIWSIDPEQEDGFSFEGGVTAETLAKEKTVAPVVEALKKAENDVEEKADMKPESEPEARVEEAKPAEDVAEVKAEEADEEVEAPPETKTKALASDTASETVAEATVEEGKTASQNEPKEVDTKVVED